MAPADVQARTSAKPSTSPFEHHLAIGTGPNAMYEKAGLRIDFDAYEASLDERRGSLTLLEFKLLRLSVSSPNRAVSREQILDAVWGRGCGVVPRTVDVHIRRLPKRIERDDARPKFILAVRGVGYQFDERGLSLMSLRQP